MLAANVEQPLTAAFNKDYEIRRVEVVGSKVGADFKRKAIIAVIFSWLAMLIYVAWRFEFRYALGGIIALVHDVTDYHRSCFHYEYGIHHIHSRGT